MPAKAGISLCMDKIPVFTGMTAFVKAPWVSKGRRPLRGLFTQVTSSPTVMPAKAGISSPIEIPVFTGMTAFVKAPWVSKPLRGLLIIFLSLSSSFAFAQESKIKDLQFYLKDLVSVRKKISGYNYQHSVYNKVCPYMKSLQQIESKEQINPTTRKKILKEVVKIYDKAYDFSGDHNLMYCVYHYYTPKKSPKEFFEIAEELVSPSKLSFFKDRWRTCEKEEREGNGDGFNISSKKESAPSSKKKSTLQSKKKPSLSSKKNLFLSKEQYQSLSPALRLSYIKKIKKAFLDFELSMKNQWQPKKKKTAWLNSLNFFIKPALSDSYKTGEPEKCLIGGYVRDVVEESGKKVCPTDGRGCGEGGDQNFRCGLIFKEACIPIESADSISETADTISKRCYEASKNEPPPNPEEYEEYRKEASDIIEGLEEVCVENHECESFIKRISEIRRIAEIDKSLLKEAKREKAWYQKTEAGATCTHNCSSPQNTNIEDLKKLVDQSKKWVEQVNQEKFMDYFLDNVYENAVCHCDKKDKGSDACSQGCMPKSEITPAPDGEYNSPPMAVCDTKEPKDNVAPINDSKGVCARHVRSAIMNTIRKKLTRYCDKEAPTTKAEYYTCLADDKGARGNKRNICEHGLLFESALCALNLDGQNSVFKGIKNTGVKTECINLHNWNNKFLYTFPIKKDDGSDEKVPLFKRLEKEKLAGYKADPESIPKGAIVVMQSSTSDHGHIEIKTDKTCGKDKDGNARSCFCSDFCTHREKNYPGNEIKAVFVWNPEILEYAKKL